MTINEPHIFEGEVNASGKAVGYHHRPNGRDIVYARMTRLTTGPDANGVYRGEVEVYNAVSSTWIAKGLGSSFFPDSWSKDRVKDEILRAFSCQIRRNGQYWEGISPSGVVIGAYLDAAGNINTAFPIRQ
ncbi:MAG TPA: EndoU domain-containing protein [Pirellulales bacterium]